MNKETDTTSIIPVNNIPPWVIADHPIVDNKHPRLTDYECVEGILNGLYSGRFKSFNGELRWWSGREWEYMRKTDLINFLFDSLPERYCNMSRIRQIYMKRVRLGTQW